MADRPVRRAMISESEAADVNRQRSFEQKTRSFSASESGMFETDEDRDIEDSAVLNEMSKAKSRLIRRVAVMEEIDAAAYDGTDAEDIEESNGVLRSLGILTALVVIANGIQMGLCTTSPEQTLSAQSEIVCDLHEHAFTIYFVVEAALKFWYMRCLYFSNGWNIFDFAMVIVSVVVDWIFVPVTGQSSKLRGIIPTRLLRVLRVLRVTRIFRAKREFVILTEGLAAAMRAVLWVALLLFLLIYIVALISVSMFGDIKTNCALTFESVPMAALTLFTISIQADWTDIVMPIISSHWAYALLFIPFVVASALGMLNLIIGVITERTSFVQQMFEQKAILSQKIARMQRIRRIADMMFSGVHGKSLTKKQLGEWVEQLKSNEEHEVHALLKEIELPLGFNLAELHNMLDRDASGKVTRTEFLEGMSRMIFCTEFQKHCILQVSIAELKTQVKGMGEAIKEMMHHHRSNTREELKVIHDKMDTTASPQPHPHPHRQRSRESREGSPSRGNSRVLDLPELPPSPKGRFTGAGGQEGERKMQKLVLVQEDVADKVSSELRQLTEDIASRMRELTEDLSGNMSQLQGLLQSANQSLGRGSPVRRPGDVHLQVEEERQCMSPSTGAHIQRLESLKAKNEIRLSRSRSPEGIASPVCPSGTRTPAVRGYYDDPAPSLLPPRRDAPAVPRFEAYNPPDPEAGRANTRPSGPAHRGPEGAGQQGWLRGIFGNL